MSDITRARTILRDLRAAATPGPWTVDVADRVDRYAALDGVDMSYVGTVLNADATLISVLAGNPRLLDAIDGMLALGERLDRKYRESWLGGTDIEVHQHAERIASAIVSGYQAVQR